jgi:hypothetical protein
VATSFLSRSNPPLSFTSRSLDLAARRCLFLFSDCIVQCLSWEACQQKTIIAANNAQTSVTCNAIEACQQTTFVQGAGGSFKLSCSKVMHRRGCWPICLPGVSTAAPDVVRLHVLLLLPFTCRGFDLLVQSEGCEEARVSGKCDTPNCQVTCDSSDQVCGQFICNGSGCP